MVAEPRICLIACDISADQNAARLATAMRTRAPRVRLYGIGGRHQEAAGVEVLLHTTHLSFTGVLGGLRRLPALVAHYRRGVALVEQLRPEVVVIVDGEILGCSAAARLRRKGIPVVLFFPPHVWFWGAWRVPLIASIPTRVISAFRQEADIYARAGIDTIWPGHPLRDVVRSNGDRARALRAVDLDPHRPLVVLMPGSRHNEIASLMRPFLGAAKILRERHPGLQFALPVAADNLRPLIEAAMCLPGAPDVVLYEPTSYDVLAAADVVLQCSGTATLETALLGVPSVIAYRCISIEYLVARLAMRVPFIGLPNILLGEMVQPEFFQHDVDARHLAAEVGTLLTDEARRAKIRSKLVRLPELLGAPGVFDRISTAVLEVLPEGVKEWVEAPTAELQSVA